MFSLSNAVLICQLKKLQSDPVLMRQKLASVLIRAQRWHGPVVYGYGNFAM